MPSLFPCFFFAKKREKHWVGGEWVAACLFGVVAHVCDLLKLLVGHRVIGSVWRFADEFVYFIIQPVAPFSVAMTTGIGTRRGQTHAEIVFEVFAVRFFYFTKQRRGAFG